MASSILSLFDELNHLLELGRRCVWCQLVETRGSTPQKAGAAMLVFPDGQQSGTLGGGCVEAEVKSRALRVLNQESGGTTEVMTFSLDNDYGWDDGLICGGRMRVLADPLDRPQAYYRTYRDLIAAGLGCTEVVALPENKADVEPGSRWLFGPDGTFVQGSRSDDRAEVPTAAYDVVIPLGRRPRPTATGGFAGLPHQKRGTILIVGGGHVGLAVAQLAAQVDFDIWILDDRDTFTSQERFPMAQRRFLGDIGRTLRDLVSAIDESTYALIVTRGHNHDEEALYHLAPSRAGYVGMIGSKRKIRLIFEDLVRKGISEEVLAKVHAPLGLSIGSQSVPEIAISIVAELIRERNCSEGT